jgi:hypothetical protein
LNYRSVVSQSSLGQHSARKFLKELRNQQIKDDKACGRGKLFSEPSTGGTDLGVPDVSLRPLFFLPVGAFPASACGRTLGAITVLIFFLCAFGRRRTASAGASQPDRRWDTLPYLNADQTDPPGVASQWQGLTVAGSESDPNKHLRLSSKAAVWNLTTSTFTTLNLPWDVFCNGLVTSYTIKS